MGWGTSWKPNEGLEMLDFITFWYGNYITVYFPVQSKDVELYQFKESGKGYICLVILSFCIILKKHQGNG